MRSSRDCTETGKCGALSVSTPSTSFRSRERISSGGFGFEQVRDKPWQISDAELSALLAVLSETRAQLLHIYFGQIAVHLGSTDSRLEKSVDRFLSRRRCHGGHA